MNGLVVAVIVVAALTVLAVTIGNAVFTKQGGEGMFGRDVTDEGKRQASQERLIKNIILAAVIVVAAIVLNPLFIVGPGYVGVLFNRLNGRTASYAQGLHFRIPFVHTVTKFDVKTKREDINAEAASKDLQRVTIHAVLNYHLVYEKVNELYVKVGQDYVQKLIDPAVNESIKAAASQYPVENIIINRQELKLAIEKSLAERLAQYHLVLESLNLVDINFAPEFNQVVEQKQVEEQKIKTAQYQRLQAEEFKKKVILEAEAEARKQELLKQTVSDKGIALQWIAKWDGRLPQYMMGDKASILLTPEMAAKRQ